MKIKGVLFDLDGTLVNTTPLILESFRHTFKEFGLPVPWQTNFATRTVHTSARGTMN